MKAVDSVRVVAVDSVLVAVVAAEHATNAVKKVISHAIVLKLVVVEEVVSFSLHVWGRESKFRFWRQWYRLW